MVPDEHTRQVRIEKFFGNHVGYKTMSISAIFPMAQIYWFSKCNEVIYEDMQDIK